MPSGPGHLPLSSSFCSSLIVPLPPSCFAPKYEILPTVRANITVQLYAGSSYPVFSRECLQKSSFYLFIDGRASRGLVYLWTDQHPPKSFFSKCHTAPICFSKAALSHHMSKKILGKTQLRNTGALEHLAL